MIGRHLKDIKICSHSHKFTQAYWHKNDNIYYKYFSYGKDPGNSSNWENIIR